MKRFNISHVYDFDISGKGVYSAKSETLSQICSFLNPVRYKVQTEVNAKSEIKLSSAYVLYWYLTDIATRITALCESGKDTEKALEAFSLESRRMFNFSDFSKIVKEHGLVPISAMPDAAHHHKGEATYVFDNRLRLGIKQICEDGISAQEVLDDIDSILTDGLDDLPESFDFTYIRTDDELITVSTLTPADFFDKYCKTDLDGYKTVRTSVDGVKETIAKQIKDGEQVVILADTRHQANQMLGILDTDFTDNTDVFGKAYSLSKDEKLRLGIIRPSAYLSLDGVAFDENGNVLRFKAQDTNGSDTGADGHYTMSAKWFDEYALSAIVNKKYL